MKILYTNKAIDDLVRLHDFIAKNNPKAAHEIAKKIQEAVDRLCDFPMLGKTVKNNKGSHSIRDLITGSYIIRYLILKHEIHILRIWHGKEDLFAA